MKFLLLLLAYCVRFLFCFSYETTVHQGRLPGVFHPSRAFIEQSACNVDQRARILRTIPKLRMIAFLGKEATKAAGSQAETDTWTRRAKSLFQRHFRADHILDRQGRDLIHSYFRAIYFETDFTRNLFPAQHDAAQQVQRRQVRIHCHYNVGKCHNSMSGGYVSATENDIIIVGLLYS